MYLKDLIIENVGPIEKIELECAFNENGNPKPIVIVGSNGSGKSTIVSYVVDALYEFGNKVFNDLLPKEGNAYKYFKMSGGSNMKLGKFHSLAFMNFEYGDRKYQYVEKSGRIRVQDTIDKIKKLDDSILPQLKWEDDESKNKKIISKIDDNKKEDIEKIYSEGAYCYFPSNRFEHPHWVNFQREEDLTYTDPIVSGKLRKNITIRTSLQENKNWMLNIILDSRVDIHVNKGAFELDSTTQATNALVLRKARSNLENILSKILEKEVTLKVNYRSRNISRLTIINKESGEIQVPSLDNLSMGQSILLNLFATIIRYAETRDLQKSVDLSDITGIVVIDDIDLHLNADLQKKILPELISLFPKVQFIITTHAPLFVLSIEKELRKDGLQIIDMPEGKVISAERFSEFDKAYEVLTDTKKFEESLIATIEKTKNPIVLVEGVHDIEYIKKASELLKKKNILEKINLQDGDGYGNLNNISKNKKYIKMINGDHKIILLYDCDTKIEEQEDASFHKKMIPKISISPIKKGIENLFSKDTIKKHLSGIKQFLDHEGPYEKPINDEIIKYDEEYIIKGNDKSEISSNKKKICDYLCANGNEEDFVNFKSIFEIIEKCIK